MQTMDQQDLFLLGQPVKVPVQRVARGRGDGTALARHAVVHFARRRRCFQFLDEPDGARSARVVRVCMSAYTKIFLLQQGHR